MPEFAFIGRSNVGKSSLLNMLAGKRGLARVSTTPGFTKLINVFTMNRTWRLVDLPGYGYAHVARKDMAQFNQAVAEYLLHRPNLYCVFALIDSGLSPQKIDLEFVEWLAINSIPFVLVFTKTDRVKAAKVRANIEAFQEELSARCEDLPLIFTCSAETKEGRAELLGVIEEAMTAAQNEAESEPEPAAQEAAPLVEDLPGTGWRIGALASHVKRPNPARPW